MDNITDEELLALGRALVVNMTIQRKWNVEISFDCEGRSYYVIETALSLDPITFTTLQRACGR